MLTCSKIIEKMEHNTKKLNSNQEVEVLKEESHLVVCNDDINTFDYVIDALMKVCNHTPEQAEQCAFIVHYKGKCTVKVGSFYKLVPMRGALNELGLTVVIE
jgi:ATP-dependent Clp protease adaptor protein ClpS